jgi:hypothetical protein
MALDRLVEQGFTASEISVLMSDATRGREDPRGMRRNEHPLLS